MQVSNRIRNLFVVTFRILDHEETGRLLRVFAGEGPLCLPMSFGGPADQYSESPDRSLLTEAGGASVPRSISIEME